MRSSTRSVSSVALAATVALLPAAPVGAEVPRHAPSSAKEGVRAAAVSPDAGIPESDAGHRPGTEPVPFTTDAGVPGGIGGQTPPGTEAEQLARAEFERAQRAYDLGRFETAIGHYSRAYEAMPLAPLLFNIAQCHRLLGEYAQAAFFYRRYLDLANNPANAPLTRELLSEMDQRQSEKERVERDAAARAKEALAFNPKGAGADGPVYKHWWFWAAVGGALAAGVTAAAVVSQPAPTTLGTLNAR